MAVEKSAVREGTRWDYRGRLVVVDEVTDKSVIFTHEESCSTEVAKLEGFLARASDPVRAEHTRLISGLRYTSHGLPPDDPVGKVLSLLCDAAVYQLERTWPGSTPYVEPTAPALKPKPALEVAEPHPAELLCAAEIEPLEDYAIVMPADEPPSVKKRRGW